MACLQIYQELLSLTTFLRVHSNSKEVSYLSWQNTYPNLKTTCHIKLKCFLWTKLLENLLLAKYLTPVAAPLRNRTYLGKTLFFNFSGANFVTLKNGHRCEKQPVLGSDCWIWANKCLQGLQNGSFRQYICFQYLEETYCIYSLFTSHKVAKG